MQWEGSSPGRISILNKNKKKAGILLFWLLVWELAALLIDNPFLLVTPLETLRSILGMMTERSFYLRIALSVGKISLGFLLGSLGGIVFAVLSFRHSWLEELIEPIIRWMKAVPVVSFVVLLFIWFGSDWLAVCICIVVVFPILYIDLLEGLKKLPKPMLELRRVYCFPAMTALFYVYIPLLEPYLMAGLKLAFGLCWKSGVAAEVIGMTKDSIGEGLYLAKVSVDTGEILGWTVVAVGLCVLFEWLFLRLTRKLLEWQVPCRVKPYVEAPAQLQCIEITKSFGEKLVLRKHSAAYNPGQRDTLDWPSGAGKTTLFRILMGLEQADSGQCLTTGRGSYLFQEDRLIEHVSALKNVEMVTGDVALAEEYLSQLLEPKEFPMPVSQLSGGMKRRVALARAMAFPADFVLLDEPFTGLDPAARQKAYDFIVKHQRGRVILIASHIEKNRGLEET